MPGLIIGISLAISLWLIVAHSPIALAQMESSQCNGVDIAFLIDQSKSMGYNDQNQLRSAAVKTAIDILGDNAVYFCNGVQHRIAVIGFGGGDSARSNTRSYLPSTTIAPTLDSLQAWKQERARLKATIPITDDLGATDHIAALRVAADVLQQWGQQPIGSERRIRMAVLVTSMCRTSIKVGRQQRVSLDDDYRIWVRPAMGYLAQLQATDKIPSGPE